MTEPLAIDLCAGLGGWADGLLAEGWEVIGFDIERHRYPARRLSESDGTKVQMSGVDFNNPRIGGSENRSFNYANQVAWRNAPLAGGWIEYPSHLVVQDVLTLHGSQFREAGLIVASPPCRFFSYTAMPWTRAKVLAAEVRADPARLAQELALFAACFRIQREACAAAGRHIPLVVENVRGAIPWVGRSRWNFGSYHLWGDVPALMPPISPRAILKPQASQRRHGTGSWFAIDMASSRGGDRFNAEQPSISRLTGSKSPARKAASAMIAKIPLPLARWIARCYYP